MTAKNAPIFSLLRIYSCESDGTDQQLMFHQLPEGQVICWPVH